MSRRLKAARKQGGEGLIAELVRVERESQRIGGNEAVGILFLLLFAGHETTTDLISESVYELVKNPGLRDWLEQDWRRVNLAVEEFLRFISPVQFTKPRFVRKDVELGGVRLRKGDRIMPMPARLQTSTRTQTPIPRSSISSGGRTGTSRSAPASTSASVISSRASRRHESLPVAIMH